MGRLPLSEDQRLARDAEKAARLATKKSRSKSSNNQTVSTEPNMPTTQEPKTETPTAAPAVPDPTIIMPTPTDTTVEPAANPSIEPPADGAAQYQPQPQFSPLGGNKTQRSYSRPVIDQKLAETVIPEANIQIDAMSDAKAKELTSAAAGGQGQLIPPVEGFSNLQPNEKQLAANQAVDMFLGGYDRLHWVGRKFVKIDMDELADDHRRGEINQYFEAFEGDKGEDDITIKEYWEDFNEQIDDEFVVSEEFTTAVRPALERIFLKRGWGASDELYVGYKFSEDLAMKVGMLVGFKRLTNRYMKEFREDHSKLKKAIAEGVAKEQAKQTALKKKIEDAAAAQLAEQNATAVAVAKKAENLDVVPGS